MKPKILVVDDEPGLRRAVERILAKGYDLEIAATPEEAIDKARDFCPEVAILDIRMPGMDGFDLMSKLKEIDPHLDVILMTGSLDDADTKMIRALREKAFYFIQKPFDREVLITLVQRCLELHRLSEENRRHVRRLESELEHARAFQQGLLPATPRERSGVCFEARYEPCDEIGGDLFDHAAIGENECAFLVADVSGHGAAAAMLTGIIKAAFQASRTEGSEPKAVIQRIAAGLRTFDESRFVTILCARVNLPDRRVEYVNAGHPPGLLWTRAERDERGRPSLTRLERTGPMVSAALEGFTWRQETIRIPEDARLLLYTDGLLETRDEQDEFFGLERLEALLREAGDDPPAEILDRIVRRADAFRGGRPRDDDLTLLLAT